MLQKKSLIMSTKPIEKVMCLSIVFYNESLAACFYISSSKEKDEPTVDSDYEIEDGEDGIAFYVNTITDI